MARRKAQNPYGSCLAARGRLRGAPIADVSGTGPCFRPVRRASNTPTEPSASSWQGLVVVPEGAPLPPGCLVATRPAGAAPVSSKVFAPMRSPCRDASRVRGLRGWHAAKRKILMARALRHADASRRANRGRLRHRALLSSGPSRISAPTDPSASSWQGLLVAPEGAPTPPECLVATRPAGAAPRPASRRLMMAPSVDEVRAL